MERRVLICIVVCFLGLLSAALAFGAEFKRKKLSEIDFYASGKCTYPRTPAFALGLTAFLVLIIAHAIINAASGCNFRNKLCSAPIAFCALFSWCMSAFASIYLIQGSLVNDRHTMDVLYYEVVEPWIFAKGAMLGLISVIAGVVYYLTISSIKHMNQIVTPVNADNPGIIAMAQPQVPAQMAQP
ncbi:hypothetical protein MKW98_011593 [Papaver atlanticum]|uniref:Uncharacterized protein n=1 Tax=Papaver atlanticum TaxID=357466 RepID=A0AAD4TLV7_9MAGN|nr:hypothetical protein MKW98_008031 [Papaver atlanticum]KAI3963559.1 hypothetical protein MKW98_011593 [Papaver atlanticum]